MNGMKSRTNTELSRDRSLDEILESTPDKIKDKDNNNDYNRDASSCKMSHLSPINVAQDQSNFISPKNNFLNIDDNGTHSRDKSDRG